jgi:hypothetical protein
MFAVLDVLKDRLFRFFVPADNVYEAGFVALLASDAFFGVKFDFVLGVYHPNHSSMFVLYNA